MEELIQGKVAFLEQSLSNLREEVDIKMKIIEQMINTRNEQFTRKKKLIEDEQAFFDELISQWRNSVPSNLSPTPTDDDGYVHRRQPQHPAKCTTSKRSFGNTTTSFSKVDDGHKYKRKKTRGSSSAKCSSNYTTVMKSELENTDDFDMSLLHVEDEGNTMSDCDTVDDSHIIEAEDSSSDEANSDELVEEDFADDTGMEKQVFVNWYSAQAPNSDPRSDQVWIQFMREESTGSAALCKPCSAKGIQKVYKLTNPHSLNVLRRHLRAKHKIVVEPPPPPPVETEKYTGKGSRPTFLRHDDFVYIICKTAPKRSKEYWRCRQRPCKGNLVLCNGIVTATSGEHDCLTTPADCDVLFFRERIREIATTQPTLAAVEVIATAKIGMSDEALELAPSDAVLRKHIWSLRNRSSMA